ncbi:RICIN domain-containing protein [Kibdelosporangium lantanae]|uniref:RICIN domain-containing protein n=1 Tax=Kibdelosporangium lantanae TaxID=1497396 RepID=A0ABW3MDJ2_9PSEU
MRKLILAIVTVLSAVTLIAPAASAAPQLYGYQIRSYHTGKCLRTVHPVDREPVIQNTCESAGDGTDYQHWYFERIGSNGTGTYFRIRNKDNMCMVVQGQAVGSPAFITPCGDFIDQYFYDVIDIRGFHQLVDYNSGDCLATNGTNVGDHAYQLYCLKPDGTFTTFPEVEWDLI